MTNVTTGQVVSTETLSTITPFTAEDRNIASLARERLPDQIRTATTQLVQQAAERFNPYPVTATVRGPAGKAYVIDRGKSAGIQRGDLFDGDVKVLFADADYSIVQPVIKGERLANEQKLSKQNLQPADYLAKQPAMVILGDAPAGMSKSYLKRVFEGKLGAAKVFNIVSVNPSLDVIRRATATQLETDVSGNVREVPEYFVYVESFVLEPTEFPTNIPGRTIKTYQAYSIAYIADRSGRVIYAQIAGDRLRDETSGIGFPQEQRQETVVGNSLDKLAGLIGSEFKPSSIRAPVRKINDLIYAEDATGSLTGGVVGTVLRKGTQVSGIKGQIWFPVNDSRAELSGNQLSLIQRDPLDPSASNGDVFAVESGGDRPGSSRNAYHLCAAPVALPDGDLSARPIIRSIGRVRFYQAKKMPLYLEGMPSLLAPSLLTFKNRGADLGAMTNRPPDLCIKPIIRFTHSGEAKASGGLVSQNYNMVMGYNILDARNEKKSGFGMSINLTTSPLPKETPEFGLNNNAYRDFIDQFDKNSVSIINNIQLP